MKLPNTNQTKTNKKKIKQNMPGPNNIKKKKNIIKYFFLAFIFGGGGGAGGPPPPPTPAQHTQRPDGECATEHECKVTTDLESPPVVRGFIEPRMWYWLFALSGA